MTLSLVGCSDCKPEKEGEKMKAITGMKACSKPVSSVIGEVDSFLLSVELSN